MRGVASHRVGEREETHSEKRDFDFPDQLRLVLISIDSHLQHRVNVLQITAHTVSE